MIDVGHDVPPRLLNTNNTINSHGRKLMRLCEDSAMILCTGRTPAVSSGTVPQYWKTSQVAPVFKRGDATDTTNYRPIAVGEPLSRSYASILAQRLVQYTEQQGLRSPTQAGYRPEHSTIHQTFVLQHVIDKHRRLKSPLYLCFVDLKSAYNLVQWQMLWDLLRWLCIHQVQ